MADLLVLLFLMIAIAYGENCEDNVSKCVHPYFSKGSYQDYAAVAACIDTVIAQNASCPEAWYEKSIALAQINNYEDALGSINESIRLYPENCDFWLEKGKILNGLNRFEEALNAFSEAVKIKPNSIEASQEKGLMLSHLGRYIDAIAAYDNALRNTTDSESLKELWNQKGDAYKAMNDNIHAEDAYSQAKKYSVASGTGSNGCPNNYKPPSGLNTGQEVPTCPNG